MTIKSQKERNKKFADDLKTYFTGNPATQFHRNLNLYTDAMYSFSLLDIQKNKLRLISEAHIGNFEFFELHRNHNQGLVITLDVGNLEFSIESAKVTDEDFQFVGTSKTATGVIAGVIGSKKMRQIDFLFIPNSKHRGLYVAYFPFERGFDLESRYLAGDLDDRLQYLYLRQESLFSNGTVSEDVFKD